MQYVTSTVLSYLFFVKSVPLTLQITFVCCQIETKIFIPEFLKMLVVNLVWDGIPDNRIYPQINTNWLSKCIHQSPWWIIYESTKIVFGQTLQLKRWLISMSCHPEEWEKRGFLESEAQRSMAIELALTGLRNERRELYADLAFLLGNLYL